MAWSRQKPIVGRRLFLPNTRNWFGKRENLFSKKRELFRLQLMFVFVMSVYLSLATTGDISTLLHMWDK